MLISSGLARPNSSPTITAFDWGREGSNRDKAMDTL